MYNPIKFLTFLILCCSLSYGQGLYNNGASITIAANTLLKIDGDANGNFTNLTSGSYSGTINNTGTIAIEGNWTNNAGSGYVFTSPYNTGSVSLNGTTQ